MVLTNFRFGRMDDFDGLASPLRWPIGGTMIAVSNEGPASTPPWIRAASPTPTSAKSSRR